MTWCDVSGDGPHYSAMLAGYDLAPHYSAMLAG